MRIALYLVFGLVALGLAGGCSKTPPAAVATPAASEAPQGYLNHALPRLATIKLWLGDQELLTEVARTPTEVQTGMMFRTNANENEAMLFVFNHPFRAAFYMRNTKVPLSSAYIDPDGMILELHDLKPLDETPVEAGTDRVQFVLETKQGWFQRHHLGTGAVVRTQYGELRDLDWRTLRPARPRRQ